MRFGSRFGTAIHMLLIINEYSKKQKVTSNIIAEIIGNSPVTVRKLLGDFKKAGFIHIAPRKDKKGTVMACSLDQITLLDIFEVVEPDHMKCINEPTMQLANRSHSGMLLNEIICGYSSQSINFVKEYLKTVTLSDSLADLLRKEKESQIENPHAFSFNNENE